MKKLCVLFGLLILLVSCVKAPVPVSDEGNTDHSPVTTAPANNPSSDPRALRLVMATVGGQSWHSEIGPGGKFLLQRQPRLTLVFSQEIDAKELVIVPAGSAALNSNGKVITLDLDKNIERVIVPASLVGTQGVPIGTECVYAFADSLLTFYRMDYPWLELPSHMVHPVVAGETLVIRLDWPLDKEDFILRLTNILWSTQHRIEWLDDRLLALTVKTGAVGSEICLSSLFQAQDIYGYSREHYFDFSAPPTFVLTVTEPKAYQEFSLRTGEKKEFHIPLAVDGAGAMIDNFSKVIFYRALSEETGLDHRPRLQQLFFSPATAVFEQRVEHISEMHPSPAAFQGIAAGLKKLPRDLGSISQFGRSHDGTMIAVFASTWEDDVLDKHAILLLDKELKVVATYPLGLQGHSTLGAWTTSLFWSFDNQTVFFQYYASGWPREANAERGIYALNLAQGKEELFIAEGTILSSSPYADCLFVQTWTGQVPQYYFTDSKGRRAEINAKGAQLSHGAWMDASRVILNNLTDGKCYIYNLAKESFELISSGVAFDYDPLTEKVFSIDRR